MTDNTEESRSSEIVTVFDRFLMDGGDKSRYQQWQRNFLVTVPANGCVVVRRRFNKNRMVVKEQGTILLNPILDEYIFAPKNSTSIDYPSSDFKFITDLEREGISVEIDLIVNVCISDPITYLSSCNNILAVLKDLLCDILRSFVSGYTYSELSVGQFSLEEIDTKGRLDEFERDYGLKVENMFLKRVELPQEIKAARIATAQSKEGVSKAEYDKQIAKHNAEAKMQYTDLFVKSIQTAGELGLSERVIEKVIDHDSAINAPTGSHVIIGNSGIGGYFPAWMLENAFPQQLPGDSERVIIDAEEDEDVMDSPHVRKRKR